MQIQVNTDDNVEGREELARRVEAEVISALSRFSGHITRVEVHLSDENADKGGINDKRCLMEARPTGRKPLAVSHQGATLEEAFTGAAKKLQAALESTLGRSNDHKGGASIRTDSVLRDGESNSFE
jgi:ribosome-associated translation inhibitor RaiA